MGEALLGGLVAGGWAEPGELAVVEPRADRREALAGAHPGVAVGEEPVPCQGAVLAVKPGDVQAACASLGALEVARVLSIAAGVPLARLESWLSPGCAVLRAMPNTPALVGAGASAVAPGSGAGQADLGWAESVLGAVGIVVQVAEPDLDAVTGLSGSGPGYLFLVAEAMIEAGVSAGLTPQVSLQLVAQTMVGSGRLLRQSGQSPEALRQAVTSPGGTTAAGLAALEARGVRRALLEAVAAATERSRQLGH